MHMYVRYKIDIYIIAVRSTNTLHITDLLDELEDPAINQVNKELEKLQKLIKQQEAAQKEFR